MPAYKKNKNNVEVVLKCPVELESSMVEKIRERLCALLEKEIELRITVDPSVTGAEILIGGTTRIEIDLLKPVETLKQELVTSISQIAAEKPEEVATVVHRKAEKLEPKLAPTVEEIELCRILRSLKEESVTLVTRFPLDSYVISGLRERLSRAAERKVDVVVKVNPKLRTPATLYLGKEKKIDLDILTGFLEELERKFAQEKREKAAYLEETGEYLTRIIEKSRPTLKVEDVTDRGTVLKVGDGVAFVSGMESAGSQEVVFFEGGVYGIAFNLLKDNVGCLLLGPEERVEIGSAVKRTMQLMVVPVGDTLIGRIVNALGQPIDGGPPIEVEKLKAIERIAPGVVRRHPVIEPLHSGIKIIDALVPLGCGQREVIIGDRKIGKTTIAVDTILSQKGSGVICVYAAIGQKASTIARVVNTLRARGALEYTIIVAALANERPVFRFLVPYTACAIAEEFMEKGQHTLVIYDDLTKHAMAYREISALLKRPIGREAYPGDIFYVHSRLLERAARLRDDLGGGSMTAIPIVETQAGDISAYIPTNVISICDGQIFLDTNLFNQGFRPPVDAGLSVSRVGGMAQTPAMKKVAGRLRIDLAQYHEMAQFVKFGAEVDEATLRQLNRGERIRELLKQDQHSPLSLSREVGILYAVINGYVDEVPVELTRKYETELFKFMETRYPEIMKEIQEKKEMPEELEKLLNEALLRFKEVFMAEVSI